MLVTKLIEKKRDCGEMTAEELEFLIRSLVEGKVEDAQMSAFMMAVCCRGMTERETADLTMAMMHSGDTVDLSDLPGVKVDKHSTGGVGDTTTLVAAPLVAACGGTVAKMSGRGLAHSGGTLDKLESVPGVCVEQPLDTFKDIVRRIGIAVIGQSADLDPADKKMYQLRDVTGTVKSIPLIASSIMSKKLAAGADAIVLDVKTGNGAFMNTLEESAALARSMVSIGNSLGRRTVAIITDMNRPLGMAIGNGLEMKEAIEVLRGEVPMDDPLVSVCLTLGGRMLMLAGLAEGPEDAKRKLEEALVSGAGYRKLCDMLEALGGDISYVENPEKLVAVKRKVSVCAPNDGYIASFDAKSLGVASCLLGAGRFRKEDKVDPAVGILMKKRCGESVRKGEPVAELYVNDESRLEDAVSLIESAVNYSEEKPGELPLVYTIIE
ncbi:MAG: thymidine phosphorylase [Clostridia bacterium]|nr:thymidine phosphorylase [Clostridia bacterium]